MRVAFRVDASVQMGTGHLIRCLTLADALAQAGAHVTIISRTDPGLLGRLVGERTFAIELLASTTAGAPQAVDVTEPGAPYAHWLPVHWSVDAADTAAALERIGPTDCLVVDHYALDHRWERLQRRRAARIMVVDDLANRPHDCDLLLDQNLAEAYETRYDALVPAACHKLLGPRYALLRPEFARERARLRPRDGSIRRVLVFLGGSDPDNVTGKVLSAIAALRRPDIAVDVVLGAASPHIEAVRAQTANLPNARLHVQVDNMAELMAAADLAIGSGGSATWERCCLGLPTIAVCIAENQRAALSRLANDGVHAHLGQQAAGGHRHIVDAILSLVEAPAHARGMSQRAAKLVDGNGDQRVGEALLAMIGSDCSLTA